jgi:hypothetical protein
MQAIRLDYAPRWRLLLWLRTTALHSKFKAATTTTI